jgi:iron(III) transport system ATP-binding protein
MAPAMPDPTGSPARVLASRYEGVQTVYQLDVLGGRLEAVEIGTSMRHRVNSTLEITLPVARCWA